VEQALDSSERRRWSRRAGLLALAALVGNAPALGAGFVLDDGILLADNPYVKSWSGLGQLLSHELFVASAEPRFVPYYRPLSGSFNWLSYRVVGGSAPLQHGINLLLHAGVVLLLFRALGTFRVRLGVAFGAALLFAVHPATAEVAAYLGGRQDMLGWLVGFSGMIFAARVQNGLQACALGLTASLLGSFFHELFLSLCVPLALLVGCADEAGAKRRGAAVLGGGVAAVGALLALRSALALLPFEANAQGPLAAVRATVGVLLRLVADALAPIDLAVDVTVPLPTAGVTALALLLAGGGSAALARAVWRRHRALLGPLLAGLSIAAASCALHAGVVLKYGIISDRYAYALLLGLVVTTAATLEAWLPAPSAGLASSPLVAGAKRWGAVGLSLALVPLTWARDASWKDQESLQLAMIRDRPDDPEAWLAEGMLHFASGDLQQAYPRCIAYARARPDSDKANLCIGSWLLDEKRPAEAVSYLRPYALARPGVAAGRRTFLFALLSSGRYEEASRTLGQWLGYFPQAPELLEAREALARLRGGAR